MKTLIIFFIGLMLVLWAPMVFATNNPPTCKKLPNPCATMNCNRENTLKIA